MGGSDGFVEFGVAWLPCALRAGIRIRSRSTKLDGSLMVGRPRWFVMVRGRAMIPQPVDEYTPDR
jgi:hypothetical protein